MVLKIVNRFLKLIDLEIKKKENNVAVISSDIEDDAKKIIEFCLPYTMTSFERIYSVCKSVEYIVNNNIEGDIVECGVWKGGSMMAIATQLKKMGIEDKKLYLYDTFEGMSEPTDADKDIEGISAEALLQDASKEAAYSIWCIANINEVKTNLSLTNYNQEKIAYVVGKVEDTIPTTIPDKIALLRLDTDWYESTYHELVHLFPKLVVGGVLIIDDYGHWAGSKKAVDTYFKENNIQMLLNRIDYTGRIGVKLK